MLNPAKRGRCTALDQNVWRPETRTLANAPGGYRFPQSVPMPMRISAWPQQRRVKRQRLISRSGRAAMPVWRRRYRYPVRTSPTWRGRPGLSRATAGFSCESPAWCGRGPGASQPPADCEPGTDHARAVVEAFPALNPRPPLPSHPASSACWRSRPPVPPGSGGPGPHGRDIAVVQGVLGHGDGSPVVRNHQLQEGDVRFRSPLSERRGPRLRRGVAMPGISPWSGAPSRSWRLRAVAGRQAPQVQPAEHLLNLVLLREHSCPSPWSAAPGSSVRSRISMAVVAA